MCQGHGSVRDSLKVGCLALENVAYVRVSARNISLDRKESRLFDP